MNNTDGLRREILHGDVLEQLKTLPAESVDMCMTSPPYWALRDYGIEGQLGLEPTFTEYINKLVSVFDEVKRVLKKEGTCWVNLGDTFFAKNYSDRNGLSSKSDFTCTATKEGYKRPTLKREVDYTDKCMVMIPERFAIEMINHGWILRSKIIWHKPNAMPSSAKDRFTVDWEYLFMFAKQQKYYFETQYQPYSETTLKEFEKAVNYSGKALKDYQGNGVQTAGDVKRRTALSIAKKMPPIGGIKQAGGDNPTYSGNTPEYGAMGAIKRCVWTIPTKPFSEAHFATYPEELVETPIKAGCPVGGIVLDPFFGSGTTGLVAMKLGRDFVGVELNEEYIKIAKERLFKGCEPLV